MLENACKIPFICEVKIDTKQAKTKENRVVKSHQEPLCGKPCQCERKTIGPSSVKVGL